METKVQVDLVTCILEVVSQLREEKKYSAVHIHTSTLNSFVEFAGGSDKVMPLNEVFMPARLRAYQEWMRQKGASWNTVSTYMRTLRAVYNRRFIQDGLEYNPKLFDGVYTKVESQTKRALTEGQMQTLMGTNFASLPEAYRNTLAYFQLMFLFRGMPFIDIAYLRKRDIKGDSIVYCRHKTGKQIIVRIPKEAVVLIKEYRDKNPASPYLFPILDYRMQEDFKIYRYYQVALRSFNKMLAGLAKLLLPGTKLSSYTARHTWATLAFYMGTPTGIICEALGHSSVRVTETYLKPFENEKIDQVNYNLISFVTKRAGISNTIYNNV